MSAGRNVLLYIVYFLIVVAIGVGVIFGFTHHSSTKQPAKKSGSSQTATDQGSSTKSDTSNDDTANSPSSPAPASSGAADATRSAINGASGSQLANTGPGSVSAVFIGATLLGALGYRRYALRRLTDV